MKIKAYLKPHCGWSNGVRAIMRKYNLAFEDIDIINNRANYAEMVQKSGQPLSPCVEIDGVMLADISGEEVEPYGLAVLLQCFDGIHDALFAMRRRAGSIMCSALRPNFVNRSGGGATGRRHFGMPGGYPVAARMA